VAVSFVVVFVEGDGDIEMEIEDFSSFFRGVVFVGEMRILDELDESVVVVGDVVVDVNTDFCK
jgi:hypothetical protein